MNSGEPGSPRNGGPPFHAYQYVRRVPSASFLVIELMPLSLMRMRTHPLIEIVTLAVLAGRTRLDEGHRDIPVLFDCESGGFEASLARCHERAFHAAGFEKVPCVGHAIALLQEGQLLPKGCSPGPPHRRPIFARSPSIVSRNVSPTMKSCGLAHLGRV